MENFTIEQVEKYLKDFKKPYQTEPLKMIDELVTAYKWYDKKLYDAIERNQSYIDEIEEWKELFFLLKRDYALQENFQTNEWMIKAREMGIDV